MNPAIQHGREHLIEAARLLILEYLPAQDYIRDTFGGRHNFWVGLID
jgi:hypothetical protein